MTTPTDQELEKVARETAEKVVTECMGKWHTSEGWKRKVASLILSALKQVQPTPITKSVSSSNELVVPTAPQKPLVDSIAVSPQEQQGEGVGSALWQELNDALSDLSAELDLGYIIGKGSWECGSCKSSTGASPEAVKHDEGCIHPAWDRMIAVFQSIKNHYVSPASTPANPPKEGSASAESEKVAREFINDLEEHRYLGEQDERERIISSLTERIANCMGRVPDIDTQREELIEVNRQIAKELCEIKGLLMASNNPPAEE